MPRANNKLTPLAVKSAAKPGLYSDGLGLYLQVSKFGTKSWLFRFMRDGVARKMGLGAVHTVSLAHARQRAAQARLELVDDLDPIEVRRTKRTASRVEAAKVVTFQDCAEKYIASNEAGWRNEKHRAQWRSTLATYAYPEFGHLPVSAIDTGLVLRAVEPIWATKAETASRLRGRIEAVLNWATVREYRTGDNPARWRGHLQNALGRRATTQKPKHFDAVPYAEMPGFMEQLRDREGLSARALEFTILTAVRTGEAIGAKWPEIDLEAKVWTVPGIRMKGGKDHRVPLSDRAFEVLRQIPRVDSDYVFAGARAGRSLSNMAMLELLRGMRGMGATVHGFRSSFRDWAAERTAHPNHVVEAALAHTIGNKVEAAYRRGDLFEKRARLMADWAGYCGLAPRQAGDVVPMRAAS